MTTKDRYKILFDYSLYKIYRKGIYSLMSQRFLEGYLTKRGYWACSLKNKEGKYKTVHFHQILAIAWIPNPHNKMCINHKNLIKTDNSLKNLEWATLAENIKDAWEKGAFENADLGYKPVLQIETNTTFGSMREAQRITGINRNGISRTARGKAKRSGGFTWKFLPK